MLKGEFSHFARILIDIDLLQPISDSLMVKVRADYLFLPLEYEHLLDFCTSCKEISHNVVTCRHGHVVATIKDGETKVERNHSRYQKKIYHPNTKSPPKVAKVIVSNGFSVLKSNLDHKGICINVEERGKSKFKGDDTETLKDDQPHLEHSKTLVVNPINEQIVNQQPISSTYQLGDQDNMEVDKDPTLRQATKESSLLDASRSDSIDTSDLSPTKVFSLRDEGWQEVQSKKKNKTTHCQYTKLVTRVSKTISQ
ncbi:hypothetical protein PanWU01x14_283250 [Parasponia andersonii]|uniref:Zinc knuckle CX2CX4HX4C n=1 Tax=Parasponia andersonii TaxID=3476 RepID=A0A2P5B0F2_PARAD|nr:hypothetical protein PanWU01x14_283250 [Parasponia andersonii]